MATDMTSRKHVSNRWMHFCDRGCAGDTVVRVHRLSRISFLMVQAKRAAGVHYANECLEPYRKLRSKNVLHTVLLWKESSMIL